MVGFALGLAKVSGFFKKHWKVFAIIFFVLSVAYAITLMVRNYNDAIEGKMIAEQQVVEWKKNSDGWKASFERAESLREQETRQAVSSIERERIVCNKRVADALQTRERINTITRVVPNENNQVCPAAGVITSNELRDALGAR